MNNENKMETLLRNLPDTPMPSGIHGRVMKKVFFVGYGRYLYACIAVLSVNLYMLATYVFSSVKNLNVVPFGAAGAAVFTVCLCAYTVYKILGFHRLSRVYSATN